MNPRSSGVAAAPLWSVRTHLVHGLLTGLGAAMLLIGTGIVAAETVYDDQEPGLSLAIAGTVLAGAAGLLLVVSGRRRLADRRHLLLGAVPDVPVADPVVRTRSGGPTGLVGSDGLAHFHRRDCSMAAGRPWPVLDRAAHERSGRRACGVCRP